MSGMEAAFASGLLEAVGNKLLSLISSEFTVIIGVKPYLSMLQDIHGEVTSWLSAVRDRAIEADPSLGWVMKLRNLTNDIYDLLDEVCLQDEKLKINNNFDMHATADFAQPWLHTFRDMVAHKVEEIKMTVDIIAKQRSDANIVMLNLDVSQLVLSNNEETRQHSLLSNFEESKIPSRDHVKSEIISKLVESKEGEGNIVSIFGLGGSGKTTLAQQICHDDKIKEHFKGNIIWIHISQDFCWDKLIGNLFEAIIGQKSDGLDNPQIICAMSNKLSGKESLLVFDDAWHEDRNDWEKFIVFLDCDALRTKILLTTRNQNVAKAVESRLVFKLAFLSENESWNFFLKSSGWVEEDLESDFIQIGKDIVKQCGGLPLAIKTLGSILRERREVNSWRAIRDGNLWDDETMERQVFASLNRSYIYLKDHLKQCFTFCSLFPKGYKINRDYLVEQWMAHGFIKLKNKELAEDIGNEYFDALMKVGFLQNPVTRIPEKSVICKMHDLIHDLTRYILQNEVVTSLPMNKTADYSQKCRYLSLATCYGNVESGRFDKVRAVCVSGCNPSFDNFVSKSCHIRSLVLDYAIDTLFPLFILKLEHLGYLEIYRVSCTELPEAISDCWNLQSLHLIICKGFATLPNSIGKLRKLRTLELNYVTDLESLPESIGNCQELQSLKVNYCEKLEDIPCSLGSMGKLRVLLIVRCSSFQFPSEFNGEFRNLRTINLYGCQAVQGLPSTFVCPMLHNLDLSETKVTLLPQWVTLIGTLECINLRNCKELVELPKGIANLRNLAVLNLVGCSKLQCMPSGFGQLTRLRDLSLFAVGCGPDDARISELENLNMICNGHMEITNLKDLKDPREAEKAMLKMKNIWSLVLDWSSIQTKDELLSDIEQDLAVLNALEPPLKIKYMEIRGYRGSCLSCWMMNQNDSCCCTGIMLKTTSTCQLLSLTKLTLEGFPNLKHVRGLLEFPSLKSFYLLKMANLEELWTTTNGTEIHGAEFGAKYCFPVLSELCITSCPKLNVKPNFPPSLVTLSFQESNEKLLSPGRFSDLHLPLVEESSSSSSMHSAVSHLRALNLKQMTASSSSWEFLQFHTELVTLSIDSCDDLTQLPESIRSLTSLKSLCINWCSNLGMLPEWLGELRSLRSLSVYTPMIDSLPQSTEHLTSLTTLQISGWHNMKQLPDVIQHLISLELLNLGCCSALTLLPEWIGQLSALRRIWIQHCSALEYLPQSIQRLTALRELKISWCQGLYRRYKRGLGPDWHLISHIPDVRIDGRLE